MNPLAETLSFEQLLDQDGHLAYTNKGVSMMPLLRQGRDVMLIEKKGEKPCRKLDAVLFRRPSESGRDAYVMHRILRVNGDGTYWIIGDNCISGETVQEEQILGILTGVLRDGKPLSFLGWRYQLYVNTWCRFYHIRIWILKGKFIAARILRKLGLRRGDSSLHSE